MPIRKITVEEKKSWKEKGYVVLRNIIDPAALDIMLNESKKLCSNQLMFSKVCQVEEGRWQSDVFRDFLFHGPLGGIVHKFIGGNLRVYQDGLIGLKYSITRPLFHSYQNHIDHQGFPGKFGGLHSDTQGAAVWVPLQDIDTVTQGGNLAFFDGFASKGCHYTRGERSTSPDGQERLNMSFLEERCMNYSEKQFNYTPSTPSVKKGDLVMWYPSMLHRTMPLQAHYTRYAWYARIVQGDSVLCKRKDCGWKGRPCCRGLNPEPGATIQTPCYPQIFPRFDPDELAAHFGPQPGPLVARDGMHSSKFAGEESDEEMPKVCRTDFRPRTAEELSWNNKADAEEASPSRQSSATRAYPCQLNSLSLDPSGQCYTVISHDPTAMVGSWENPFGLPLFASKNPKDLVTDAFLGWGAHVWGVDENDGWVRVDQYYTPLRHWGFDLLTPFSVCSPIDQYPCTEQQRRGIDGWMRMPVDQLKTDVGKKLRTLEYARERYEKNRTAAAAAWQGKLDSFFTAAGETGTLPVPSKGLQSWYQSEDAGNRWPSTTGGDPGRNLTGEGWVENVSDGFGRQLLGDASTAFTFNHVIKQNFTICSVTRYRDFAQGRILNGRRNWLHGHWKGYAGVAYYDGWRTPSEMDEETQMSWVVLCGTNTAPRVYLNGSSVGISVNFVGRGNDELVINTGFGTELSHWAVMEVVTWSRELSGREMKKASEYLLRKLDGRPVSEDSAERAGYEKLRRLSQSLETDRAAFEEQRYDIEDSFRSQTKAIQDSGLFMQRRCLYTRESQLFQCSPLAPELCDAERGARIDELMALPAKKAEALTLEAAFKTSGEVSAKEAEIQKGVRQKGLSNRQRFAEAAGKIKGLPVNGNGLVSWFRSEDAGLTWPSRVGNHTGRLVNGTAEVVTESGHGASAKVRYIRGDTSAQYLFGSIVPEAFTVCSITRYAGPNQGRVLTSTERNWIHGHFCGFAGSVFYMQHNTMLFNPEFKDVHEWVVTCGTNGAELVLHNGVNIAQSYADGAGGAVGVGVNTGYVKDMGCQSRSDWAVMELLTWDRVLSEAEMERESAHLLQKLEGIHHGDAKEFVKGIEAHSRAHRAYSEGEAALVEEGLGAFRALEHFYHDLRMMVQVTNHRIMEASVCGPAAPGLCDAEQNKAIDRVRDMPLNDFEHELSRLWQALTLDFHGQNNKTEPSRALKIERFSGSVYGIMDETWHHRYHTLNSLRMLRWHRLRTEVTEVKHKAPAAAGNTHAPEL